MKMISKFKNFLKKNNLIATALKLQSEELKLQTGELRVLRAELKHSRAHELELNKSRNHELMLQSEGLRVLRAELKHSRAHELELNKSRNHELMLQSEELRVLKAELKHSRAHELELNKSRNHELTLLVQRVNMLPVLSDFNYQDKRNFLPNDSAVGQKNLILSWRAAKETEVGCNEFLDSGFRVYSQNDEDGILLRIFSQIGTTNKNVVEIGSNCSGSELGIPENLSTNLVVNHGWHGSIFDIDEVECSKISHFYASHLSTKHFHQEKNGVNNYYSPLVVSGAIYPENINIKLNDIGAPKELDLMVIDIDGGDFSVVKALNGFSPRVLVVEFEKRFREKFSVFQTNSDDFSSKWAQSGSVSLPAWEWLLNKKGYSLCAVSTAGFNAFFIKTEIAEGKLCRYSSKDIFDIHPIFSKLRGDFWLDPDETWETVS
jgi:hypothetical protein